MNILQINSTLNWGSTGRIAEDIGKAIIKEGGESYIAYGRYANSTQSESIRIGNKWDIYYHVLQTRLFDKHGLASKKETVNLIDEIKEINPDIIHLHNIHGYYLNYPILFEYLASSKIPIVWTLHDCWSFTGHCSHYMSIGCNRWQAQCYHCPLKKDYPKSLFFDRSEMNYKEKKACFCSVNNLTLVPVSDWLAGEVKKSFFKNKKCHVIHNGIDINTFSPVNSLKEKLELSDKFVVLGVCSVWTDNKGLPDFYKLREKLSENYAIILIGLTKTQIKQLPKGIIGVERTNSVQELASYYSSADVFFNPTWEDNFPTTNLEALACGTPVITYRTGGSSEAIDERTGFVVEQGDLDGTILAINQIETKGKEAYKRVCRKRVVRYFNKEDRYVEYLQLYNEILKNK